MSIPLTNLKTRASADLERNDFSQPSTSHSRKQSKSMLFILIFVQCVCLIIVIKHREKIDNINQLLNSALLGILTSMFGQSMSQLYKQVNYNRILKFMAWGLINGLLSALWIDLLVNRFDSTLLRVLVDQIVGSPIFQLIFVILNCVWDDNDIPIALKTVYFRTLKFSYLLWPACSLISFQYLPTHLIFPFNCFVTLIWNIILSVLT